MISDKSNLSVSSAGDQICRWILTLPQTYPWQPEVNAQVSMEKSKDQDNEDVCAKGLNTCGRCGESLSTITKLIRHQQKHRIEDRKSGNPAENPDTSRVPRPRRSTRATQTKKVSTVTKSTTPALVDLTGDDDVETPGGTSVLSRDILIRALGNVQVNFV